MQSASNNYYIVQNFKIITFQVFESFNNDQNTLEVLNNDQRFGETLTRLKSFNGVTRFPKIKVFGISVT